MLSTFQKKATDGSFAITDGFAELVNWVEEESQFSVSSTEEVGPPTDPSVTAPVIFGSQSTTFGSRTVILVSTAAPGSYILPANIGYRINFQAGYQGYNLPAIGGETVDLGELRNRISGTQSIRIYGSISPYKMQYFRFTVRGTFMSPNRTLELLCVAPTINLIPVDFSTITNKVTFTDNWGGSGILYKRAGNLSGGFTFEVKRPNNSFPNCARYLSDNGQQTGGVAADTIEAIRFLLADFVGDRDTNVSISISTGEFKPSGLAASTNFAEENAAVTAYNQQFGTNLQPFVTSVYRYYFFGGICTSCLVTA